MGTAKLTNSHNRKMRVCEIVDVPRIVAVQVSNDVEHIHAQLDSDWARCRRTACSTRGGHARKALLEYMP